MARIRRPPLTPEERSAHASKAGKASQQRGTAHRWTYEEARAAGLKGAARRLAQRTAGQATPAAPVPSVKKADMTS